MKPWCEKYKPKDVNELAVGSSSISKLKDIIERKGIAMISGPTGCGKTTAVETIAKEGDYELVEMNASDFRNTEGVNSVVGGSLQQQSLFAKEKIVLVDEINGIAGREDRGGVQALSKLMKDNKHALVLCAEDPWHKKINSIRKKSEVVKFDAMNYLSIVKVLERICNAENVEYDKEDLKVIGRRVGGDLRAAINDLQIHSCFGKVELGEDNEDNERGKESNITDALRIVLKSTKWDNVNGVYDRVPENHKDIMLWLEQNIPYEYKGEELSKAFDSLSRADIFNRRIMRWQHWRYLVYIYQLLSNGVAFSKEESKKGFVMYKRGSRPLKIWMNNQKNFKRKTISEKLSGKFHTSKKGFIQEDLPHLKILAKHGKLPELGLDEEEIEWLKK
ncbi:replication factor C large subunit [Candidatus Woesearchaeota archaeon]|jgi:replication factor C large subunit|nr:replication factor C large subunit [Candidatus Woesearchaeota archaeon]MBT6044830.1 replication factor C large subunit [Candidatus Woesearchaeota archaeon]